jgi:hypothetical protein
MEIVPRATEAVVLLERASPVPEEKAHAAPAGAAVNARNAAGAAKSKSAAKPKQQLAQAFYPECHEVWPWVPVAARSVLLQLTTAGFDPAANYCTL